MTLDEMIAMLQAFKDGKTIQTRINGEWLDAKNPYWNFAESAYRVKPEPIVMKVFMRTSFCEWEVDSPNLELEFINGVLTGAKVL